MTDIDELLSSDGWHGQSVVEVDEPAQSLIIFRLGGQTLALPGSQVREILPPAEIFFVPGCPADMPGVINLRGDILSIIRLGQLLAFNGLEGSTLASNQMPKDSGMILVTRGQVMALGFLVDEVLDLIEVPQSALKPPLATLPAQLLPWILATLDWNQEAVTCLDAEAMLRDYRTRLNAR